IEDLTISLLPPGSIKGRLTIASDATGDDQLDLSKVTIDANFTELTILTLPSSGARANVSKTGEFEFAHVSEGTLFIRPFSLGEGWFVSGMRLDGEDVLGSGFSVPPVKERTLEVIVSNAGGAVTGVIKDRQDKLT